MWFCVSLICVHYVHLMWSDEFMVKSLKRKHNQIETKIVTLSSQPMKWLLCYALTKDIWYRTFHTIAPVDIFGFIFLLLLFFCCCVNLRIAYVRMSVCVYIFAEMQFWFRISYHEYEIRGNIIDSTRIIHSIRFAECIQKNQPPKDGKCTKNGFHLMYSSQRRPIRMLSSNGNETVEK